MIQMCGCFGRPDAAEARTTSHPLPRSASLPAGHLHRCEQSTKPVPVHWLQPSGGGLFLRRPWILVVDGLDFLVIAIPFLFR